MDDRAHAHHPPPRQQTTRFRWIDANLHDGPNLHILPAGASTTLSIDEIPDLGCAPSEGDADVVGI